MLQRPGEAWEKLGSMVFASCGPLVPWFHGTFGFLFIADLATTPAGRRWGFPIQSIVYGF
jgi:hypothetical protein